MCSWDLGRVVERIANCGKRHKITFAEEDDDAVQLLSTGSGYSIRLPQLFLAKESDSLPIVDTYLGCCLIHYSKD